MLKVKVINLRKGPWGNALAFFGIVIGTQSEDGEFVPVFQVRDCVLKEKKDGGFWVQFPAKLREKNGEPELDDKGFKKYDNYFDIAFEDGKPTKAGFKAKDLIVAAAEEAYKAAGKTSEGRGGKGKVQAKGKAAPKGGDEFDEAAGDTGAEAHGSPLGESEEDDELPF